MHQKAKPFNFHSTKTPNEPIEVNTKEFVDLQESETWKSYIASTPSNLQSIEIQRHLNALLLKSALLVESLFLNIAIQDHLVTATGFRMIRQEPYDLLP